MSGACPETCLRGVPGQTLDVSAEGRREQLRGVRRLVAEHMTRAHREVPPVTWVEECDFGRVDLKLLVPTVLRACALSLKEFPELNARLEGDDVVYLDRYDLGVAVQTEQGLVVPVVRGCDERSVEELGSDAYLFASLPGHEHVREVGDLVARIDPRAVPARGQTLTIRIRPNEVHLFSPSTGERLN